MTTITLQVDDNIGSIYQSISQENKQQFDQVVTLMLQRAANNVKCDKVKKMIEDIQSDPTLNNLDPEIVWGTFYDIRRYGGLQIFLRAIMGNGSLILSSQDEAITGHLARLRKHGVTHISGTPSHWRRVLLSGGGSVISPQYIRLSGEIADQPILDMLRATFENSKIVHAFASTEAGVAFEVDDGLAGFPQD